MCHACVSFEQWAFSSAGLSDLKDFAPVRHFQTGIQTNGPFRTAAWLLSGKRRVEGTSARVWFLFTTGQAGTSQELIPANSSGGDPCLRDASCGGE